MYIRSITVERDNAGLHRPSISRVRLEVDMDDDEVRRLYDLLQLQQGPERRVGHPGLPTGPVVVEGEFIDD